jgi:hypothetical protein
MRLKNACIRLIQKLVCSRREKVRIQQVCTEDKYYNPKDLMHRYHKYTSSVNTRQCASLPLNLCRKLTLTSPTPIPLQKPQPLRNPTPPIQRMFPLQLCERNTISTLHRLIVLDTPYTSLIRQRVTLTPGLKHDFSETRSKSSSF